MKAALFALFAMALAGCDQIELAKQGPPRVVNGIEVESGIDIERLIRETPGLTKACAAGLRKDGLAALAHNSRTADCFEMGEPRRWRGLWLAEFEGSQFCPEPAKDCELSLPDAIWLDGFHDMPVGTPGKLYRVDFIGRRTLLPGHHGHLGMFKHEIIVDRPISIEEVKDQADRESDSGRAETQAAEGYDR